MHPSVRNGLVSGALVGLLAMLGGCGGGGSDAAPSNALSENDFVSNPGVRLQTSQVGITFMEPSDAPAPADMDTGTPGTDLLPLRVDVAQSYTYSLDPADDTLSKARLVKLPEQTLVFEITPASPSATVTLAPGDYNLILYSGYTTAQVNGVSTRTVFLHPAGSPEPSDSSTNTIQATSFERFVPGHRALLLSTKSCEVCILQFANLSGVDLTQANLSRARLESANLSGTNLTQADLRRAQLHFANLSDAKLGKANLVSADLHRADLRRADLTLAQVMRAWLDDADLRGANLSKASLILAQLPHANLSGATILTANFSGADLTGADLTGATSNQSNFLRANLAGAKLNNASLVETGFENANLTGANFSGANLTGAVFTGANVTGTNFTGANLTGTIGLNLPR